ncbi:hypothetical protein HZA56_09360 [Candidatus Poribacteria bacterium]|nr:hypothetical protein [Candidatus Poribacteria bacterium]
MRKIPHRVPLFAFVTLICLPAFCFAQPNTPEQAIDSGRSYLMSAQNDDGTWSAPPRQLIDTVEVGMTLYEIGFEGNVLDETVNWLGTNEAPQDDYLARIWRLLVHSNASRTDNVDGQHPSIFAHIASLQNGSGGWGITYRYESDPYGTLLSLETLFEAGYEDKATLERGIAYLLSKQQPDGSWTFTDDEDGNLALSASIVIFLSKYNKACTFLDQTLVDNVPLARQNGAQWISGFQRSDGGYWMTESNTVETALALIALLYNSYSPGFGNNAFTYLLDNQLANGSWENDAYSTALALRAIKFAKSLANVGVADSDIMLMNPPALTNTVITFNAKVRNLGGIALSGVTASFFDKDPSIVDPGTGQLPVSIGTIGPFDMPVGFTMFGTFFLNAAGWLGPQTVFVVADSANAIQEIDETNNKASFTFDIVLPPPTGFNADGGNGTIGLNWTPLSIPGINSSRIKGYNMYRDGSPVPINGVNPVHSSPYVDAGLVNGQEYAYRISAIDNDDIEGPLSASIIGVPIAPPAGIDLTAFSGEFAFSPASGGATVNQSVTMTAIVRNIGLTGAGGFAVSFHDGNPASGGQLISQVTVSALAADSATTVTRQWTPTAAGAHQIYLSVDRANAIAEANEGNNVISKSYVVTSLPDLSVSASEIEVLPARPLAGNPTALASNEPLYVKSPLHNVGGTNSGVFDVKISVKNSGGTELYSYSTPIDNLDASEGGTLFSPAGIKLAPGDYSAFVELDTGHTVTELSEANNIASKAFHVMTLPDLVISNMEMVPSDFQPGDTVSIRVTVQNLGELNAFYPDAGGFATKVFDMVSDTEIEQIGNDLMLWNLVGAGGANSHTFEVSYTVKPGPRYIYGRTDATNVIGESNGANNDYYIAINMSAQPDIAVFNSDIKLPEKTVRTGDDCTVELTVRNSGAAAANNVLVRFYDLDVTYVERLIDERTIPVIAPGSANTYSVIWQPIQGAHKVFLYTDPDNAVAEADEDNNVAAALFTVYPQLDIEIEQVVPDNCPFIQFSDDYPRDGDTIAISADFTITGVQAEQYDDLLVQFYAGNPSFEGVPVGEPVTPVLKVSSQQNKTLCTAQTLWDTSGFEGDREIYVVLDPMNNFEEINEANNAAVRRIEVSSPNIVKKIGGDLIVSPSFAEQGDTVRFSALVRNDGNVRLENESIQMIVFMPNSNVPVYTNAQVISSLEKRDLLHLDFGQFDPLYVGTHDVVLVAMHDDVEITVANKTVTVGPFASGIMTVTPTEAVVGDAPAQIRLNLRTLNSIPPLEDPLFFQIREAIREGSRWEATWGPWWVQAHWNTCFGCHVQSQNMVGLELSRDRINLGGSPDEQLLAQINTSSYYLLDNMLDLQEPSGAEGGFNCCNSCGKCWVCERVRMTSHFVWALTYYHEPSLIQTALTRACDFLLPHQQPDGSWLMDQFDDAMFTDTPPHDWQNDKEPHQPSTYFSATIVKAMAQAYTLSGDIRYRNSAKQTMQYLVSLDYASGQWRNITATFIVAGLRYGMNMLDPAADITLLAASQSKINDVRNYLLSVQNSNGSWGMYPGAISDPIATACSLHALALAGVSGLQVEMVNGIIYLLNTQQADGSWQSIYVRGSTYPDERFNVTTWAMIALPIGMTTVERINVDVHLSIPDNIIVTGHSIVPIDSYSVYGGTKYTWNFPAVKPEGEDLFVDIVLDDLSLNEERPVALDADLSFIHSYTTERISRPIEIPSVKGVYPLDVSLSTDKSQYAAYEAVQITETLRSLSTPIPTAKVKLVIKDPSGNTMAELGNFIVTNVTTAPQTFNFTWNTSNNLPGAYTAFTELRDVNDTLFITKSASFEILSDLSFSTSVFTDKAEYSANEIATITGKVENQSQNHVFQNLKMTETITNNIGAQVGYFEANVPAILIDNFESLQFQWNTASNEAGAYTVTQRLYDSADLLTPIAVVTAAFTITAAPETNVGVSGSIVANPRWIYYGQSLNFEYSVTNTGNVEFVNDLDLSIVVKDPVTLATVHTITNTISLAVGVTQSFIAPYMNVTLPVKNNYAVSLQADYEGNVIPIDSTSFDVIDSTPPETQLLTSEPLFLRDNTNYAKSSCYYSLIATDDLSGVNRTEINIDSAGFVRYTNPVSFTLGGPHTIDYFSVDNAQNVEDTHHFGVVVDDVPPVTTDDYAGQPCTNAGTVGITLVATDNASGVRTTYYSLDGGSLTEGVNVQIAGDGVHTISYHSVDNLGNTEAAKTRTVQIDGVAPVTTHDYAYDGQWRNDATATINLTATDIGCGVDKTYYIVDGAPAVIGTTVVITAEGDHTATYYSVDMAGNQEAPKSISVKLDWTPPVTANDYGSAGVCVSADAVITLSASDNLSGIAHTYYSIDGGAQVEGTSVNITAEGDHTVAYYSVDVAGNTEGTHTLSVVIDKTAPATIDDYTNDGTWVNTDANITLTASDAHCGVQATRYSIDGGAEVTGTSIIITAEGAHTVNYYSVDIAGNTEATKSISVKIDKTAPVTTNDYGSAGVCVSADAVITLSASDNLSGIAHTYYSIGGGAQVEGTSVNITAEGNHTVTYYSVDVAGNTEATHTLSVVIDKTAPVTIDDYTNDGTWVNTDANITLTASDAHCGVQATRCSIDGGAEVTGTSIIITAEGAHTVNYYSVDIAGNTETARSISVRIDKTAPVTANDYGSAGVCVSADAVITLSASDNLSGIAHTYYSIDGGAQVEGTSVNITAEGDHTVTYYSVDVAGNTEASHTLSVVIDKTAPVTSHDYQYHDIWVNFDANITLTATDNFCGVAATYHTINNGASLLTNPFLISEEGVSIVNYWSVDIANNAETPKTFMVKLDKTASVTTLTPAVAPVPYEGNLYTVLSNTYSLSATDNLSGIDRIEYRIDSGQYTMYAGPFSLLSEGPHTIYYRSLDIAGNLEFEQSLTVTVVVPNLTKQLASEPRVLIWTGEEELSAEIPQLGPAFINTSGKHPLDSGMLFDPFTVTSVTKTAIQGNKFKVRSLSVSAPFDFSQFSGANVTARVYDKYGFMVDEEIVNYNSAELPVATTDANPGHNNENLVIDAISSGAVSLTFGTTTQLGDEYHFVVTIENVAPAQYPLFIQNTLSQAGIPFTTVVNRSDFITEFRSGLHNVYLLYGEERHAKDAPASQGQEEQEAEDRLMKEIREAVFKGDGLIVINSGDEGVGRGHRNDSRLREAMGGKIKGQFAGTDHTVTLTGSVVTDAGSVQAPGRVLIYEPETAQSVGSTDFVEASTNEIKALSLKTAFAFLETQSYTITASLYSPDGSVLIDEENVSFSGGLLPSITTNAHYGTVASDIMIDPFQPGLVRISLVKEGGERLDDEYRFMVVVSDSTGVVYTAGPTNVNTSGGQPLEIGMDFGSFEVTGINETATGYLRYRVISLRAPYAFIANDSVSLRATVYSMDGVSIVDEETAAFNTANLPTPAVNYIHGSRNGDLSIDRVTDNELHITLTVPEDARLASEYVFEIEVADGGGTTLIGPTRIHTSGSQPIGIGYVFDSYTVTSLIEALGAKPAVTMNDYGLGRSVFVTFDVEQSADAMTDDSLLRALILKSTAYAAPFVQAPDAPSGVFQMTINAENDAAIPISANVTETLPASFEVIASAGGLVTTNPGNIEIDWSLDLAGNSSETLLLVLRAPGTTGNYDAVTNLDFDLGDGRLEPIPPVHISLALTAAAGGKANDVIAQLDALSITSQQDINRRDQVRALIVSARDRVINSQDDVHENIKDILKAGDELIKIESVNIGDVRVSLAELLRIYEIEYYLY